MSSEKLEKLLVSVAAGHKSVGEALGELAGFSGLALPNLGFARPDPHRLERCGIPEAVYCEGKLPSQVVKIARELLAANGRLIATRADPEIFEDICKLAPRARYYPLARTVAVPPEKPGADGLVVVVTAGTSDIPIAEEAQAAAESLGSRTAAVYDVGVAGLHRLLDQVGTLRSARVIVAVAGMEGALPSVISGLVSCPVIAVPTSVGYGSTFGGLAALLAMLSTCAPGVGVVGIDNGFGAGCLAHRINAPATNSDKEALR